MKLIVLSPIYVNSIFFCICSCPICNSNIENKRLLDAHMRQNHPNDENPFGCTKCSKRFGSIMKLKRHESVHLPEELKLTHQCSMCPKRFSKLVNVQAHIRAIHTGERSFICEGKRRSNWNSNELIIIKPFSFCLKNAARVLWPKALLRNIKSHIRTSMAISMARRFLPHIHYEFISFLGIHSNAVIARKSSKIALDYELMKISTITPRTSVHIVDSN